MEVVPEDPAQSSPDTEESVRPARRRRTLIWLAFGLVGLLLGVVWAVGIAASTATVDTAGAAPAPQVFGTPPAAAPASAYTGLISEDTPLTIGFVGTWGKVDNDTPIFNVDLSGESAGTFFTTVYLTNNPTGWSALELEFRQVNVACSAAVAGDWAGPAATSVIVVENEDAYATFNSLAAGGQYCLGIQAIAKANDPSGTFIRRPSSSSSPTAPAFAAILNRSS